MNTELIIVVAVLLIVLIYHPHIFCFLHKIGRNTTIFFRHFKRFVFYNNLLVEIFFILLYAGSQVLLIHLVNHVNNTKQSSLIISYFAIALLSIFAIEKLILRARMRSLEKKVAETETELQHTKNIYLEALRNNDRLAHILTQVTGHAKPQNIKNKKTMKGER